MLMQRLGLKGGSKSRGDTIVEVLICIALIGSVLGAAFAAANRSSSTVQDSQERSQSQQILQAQVEQVRNILFGADRTEADKLASINGDFCISDDSPVPVGGENEACTNDRYSIKISRGSDMVYTFTATWDKISGGTSKTVMYYRAYSMGGLSLQNSDDGSVGNPTTPVSYPVPISSLDYTNTKPDGSDTYVSASTLMNTGLGATDPYWLLTGVYRLYNSTVVSSCQYVGAQLVPTSGASIAPYKVNTTTASSKWGHSGENGGYWIGLNTAGSEQTCTGNGGTRSYYTFKLKNNFILDADLIDPAKNPYASNTVLHVNAYSDDNVELIVNGVEVPNDGGFDGDKGSTDPWYTGQWNTLNAMTAASKYLKSGTNTLEIRVNSTPSTMGLNVVRVWVDGYRNGALGDYYEDAQ